MVVCIVRVLSGACRAIGSFKINNRSWLCTEKKDCTKSTSCGLQVIAERAASYLMNGRMRILARCMHICGHEIHF